jgi:hypothetical protein
MSCRGADGETPRLLEGLVLTTPPWHSLAHFFLSLTYASEVVYATTQARGQVMCVVMGRPLRAACRGERPNVAEKLDTEDPLAGWECLQPFHRFQLTSITIIRTSVIWPP